MNAFTIVIVLVAALALLALIFSFIAVRGKNGPWGLFSALFSLGAGVLLAISLRRKECWAQWLILPSQP